MKTMLFTCKIAAMGLQSLIYKFTLKYMLNSKMDDISCNIFTVFEINFDLNLSVTLKDSFVLFLALWP
jgi:hypothetical protein